jgi:hypothetical protein
VDGGENHKRGENMKNVTVKEWADLTPAQKETARGKEIDAFVEFSLDFLNQDLNSGIIDEEAFYKELGCSKYYAESTSWFVPSCYYEKHREEVDAQVKETLEAAKYSNSGGMLYLL